MSKGVLRGVVSLLVISGCSEGPIEPRPFSIEVTGEVQDSWIDSRDDRPYQCEYVMTAEAKGGEETDSAEWRRFFMEALDENGEVIWDGAFSPPAVWKLWGVRCLRSGETREVHDVIKSAWAYDIRITTSLVYPSGEEVYHPVFFDCF